MIIMGVGEKKPVDVVYVHAQGIQGIIDARARIDEKAPAAVVEQAAHAGP